MTLDPCPCGSDLTYRACCGALHVGARLAETPEELMRSRYSAFAKHDADYLLRTWHPRTRPADVDFEDGLTWIGLEIVDATDREVEFVAVYQTPAGMGALSERSRFERRGGRWVYVDGDVAG
ncbi:YchJ family metal-binding protein [Microbacterium sp. NPDC096154]|uniref:YchJ family protein n=1 Tax=Microbacterium sp. NPDC096154 TaxID=3155549 RepID=UPI0033341C3A